MADILISYLSKYFHRREESYQISRNIREMVVFAQHNLLKDPPFTNIDLISCRNLLIYLQPVLQRRVLDFFNFSLNPTGILFLGLSETTGEMAEYFEVKDAKQKIYGSKGRGKRLHERAPYSNATDTRFRVVRDTSAGLRRAIHTADEERILERFIETVAGDIFPLTFVVNEQMEVLHIMGETEGYVKLSSGKVTNDVTRMITKDIAIPISTVIQKVIRNNKEVRFSNITTKILGEMKSVDLRIIPLVSRKGQYPLIAVMINEKPKEKPADSDDQSAVSYDMTKETEQRLQDLEQELQFSRENLQATIEELETSNEELQAQRGAACQQRGVSGIHIDKQLIVTSVDITERKQGEEKIARSLEEKTILMRELRHRVINNLVMINHFINLEESNTSDPNNLKVLKDLNSRVSSFAELYSLLNKSSDINQLQLDTYIANIVSHLRKSIIPGEKDVKIIEEYKELTVDTDAAASWGLIVNELITNSLKYAFESQGDNRITVKLDVADNEIIFEISDNGKPLPEDFDIKKTGGTGLFLVKLLAQHLRGNLAIARGSWKVFSVTAPLKRNQN